MEYIKSELKHNSKILALRNNPRLANTSTNISYLTAKINLA